MNSADLKRLRTDLAARGVCDEDGRLRAAAGWLHLVPGTGGAALALVHVDDPKDRNGRTYAAEQLAQVLGFSNRWEWEVEHHVLFIVRRAQDAHDG